MRRPSAAREALRFSPLVQAGWTYASRVEGAPLVAAGAEPFVFFAGRPAAVSPLRPTESKPRDARYTPC
jgi:hypothetical protein